MWMTCVAYILFSIKWLLNIEVSLARIILVYACYCWFLIKRVPIKWGPSLIFLVDWLIHNSTDLAFTNFSLHWESYSFFFLVSIIQYFLLMSSRNLFFATGSMLSYICFFLCFLMMRFPSISVILHEQQINCISCSTVCHSYLFWIILLVSSTRLSTPWMCFVCFITGEWLFSYVRRENNFFTFVFCW